MAILSLWPGVMGSCYTRYSQSHNPLSEQQEADDYLDAGTRMAMQVLRHVARVTAIFAPAERGQIYQCDESGRAKGDK